MDKRIGIDIFQGRHTHHGQQVHEKILNITNHQGNANQNHNHLTPVRMDIIRKTTTTSAGKNAEKGNPYALLVGM